MSSASLRATSSTASWYFVLGWMWELLNNQHRADVLSPRPRMHSWWRPRVSQSMRTNQMVTAIAKNSRKLFAVQSPYNGDDGGMARRHARPVQLNPPNPKGQESEMAIWDGFRRVMLLREIPCRARSRKAFHSSRSAISGLLRRCL